MAERSRDVLECAGCAVLKPQHVEPYGVVCVRTAEHRSVIPARRPKWCPMWLGAGRPGHPKKEVGRNG
jgi:hypothetical protein